MGPTASGKTQLAVDLAQRLPVQIVNVDSAQIYAGMDIGTGKPDAQTLRIAPHRLINIRDPAEAYSASDFREDVLREIEDIQQQGDTPLLVGGTMLYFKVLRDGLAQMPNADPKVRQEIAAMAQEQGWEAVHARLAEVDPESAQRIHLNDPQRLQRALEVFLVSGKSMTEHHSAEKAQLGGKHLQLPFKLHFFATQGVQRSVLHANIERRFRQMLSEGLVAEVESLHARDDLNLSLPSMKSVGYRQVWQYLDGQLDYDAMVEKSIIATRQLAKRQLTWLRSWQDLQSLGDPAGDFGAKSIESIEKALKNVESISI